MSVETVERDIPESSPPVAQKSSFYVAMRILPPPQRDAMYRVYAFCRAVDDIADGDDVRADPKAALEEWRNDIRELYRSGRETDLTQGLRRVVHDFKLKEADFLAVIDGMEMDALATVFAPDWTTLDHYCDCVASAVGRLSSKIFGLSDEAGTALSHHLGRALQLTNILRDVDEDANLGRLYLPREALHAAGIFSTDPQDVVESPNLDAVCRKIAETAREHFDAADAIMDAAPRAAVKSPRLMASAYRTILDRLMARGWAAPRTRVRMSRRRVLLAALRYGII